MFEIAYLSILSILYVKNVTDANKVAPQRVSTITVE